MNASTDTYRNARDAFRASHLGDVTERILRHADGAPYAYVKINRVCSRDEVPRYLDAFACLALDHDGYMTLMRFDDGTVCLDVGVSGPADAIEQVAA